MRKIILVLLAVAACKTPTADAGTPKSQTDSVKTENTKAEAKLLVAIARTACFGRCPIYRAELLDDGTLVFVGERFTAAEGRQQAQLSKERVDSIIARLEQSDFAKWKDSYEQRGVTDMPSAILTFRDKTIRHYHGDRSAPEALKSLEDAVDTLLGIQGWIRQQPVEQ